MAAKVDKRLGDREVPATRDDFVAVPVRPVIVAAAYVGMPEDAVRRLVVDGTVPGVRVGRSWRVSTRGLLRVLDGETPEQ